MESTSRCEALGYAARQSRPGSAGPGSRCAGPNDRRSSLRRRRPSRRQPPSPPSARRQSRSSREADRRRRSSPPARAGPSWAWVIGIGPWFGCRSQLDPTANSSMTTPVSYTNPRDTTVATHDMDVNRDQEGFVAVSAFGTAWMVPGDGFLDLRVEVRSAIGLNRVRHARTGLITFDARSEKLAIEWQGDVVGPTLPPDLKVLTVAKLYDTTLRIRRVTFTGEISGGSAHPISCMPVFCFRRRAKSIPNGPCWTTRAASSARVNGRG